MISLIAAMGRNRELGLANKLPWHLPDDLKRFKKLTRGHTVIMGRKTYESIGKPLPERKNIVITRDPSYRAAGCAVVNSMEDALREAGADSENFVIGGAEIYALALPFADKIYLTAVDAERQADAYFPKFEGEQWRVITTEPHQADGEHIYPFVFKIYEKKK